MIYHKLIQNLYKKHTLSFLVCASLVFLLSVSLAQPVRADGASLYISPASGTFFIGSTFDVSIFVNTGDENVNALEVNLQFDPKRLQVASPTSGKSFIEVWVAQPTYSNIKGTVSFIGGVPSPGINTNAGLVSTVTFRAIAPGQTEITFLESSKVLRNDPDGTNILTSKSRGVYSIIIPPPEGPTIFSSTHPDQNKWYKDNNPNFSWEKEEGVTGFSYTLDKDAIGVPDNISEGNHSSISYSDIGDGIWYFHVKSQKGEIWGGASHYLVKIDKSSPALFTPTIDPSDKTIEKQPLISFITTDALSGLDYYQIKYIDVTQNREEQPVGFFIEATSPYKLPPVGIGEYLIVVRAYDEAGNFREGTAKVEIFPDGIYLSERGIHYRQLLIPWWLIILVLLIVLALTLYLYRLRHERILELREDELVKRKDQMEEKQKEITKAINKIESGDIHRTHNT